VVVKFVQFFSANFVPRGLSFEINFFLWLKGLGTFKANFSRTYLVRDVPNFLHFYSMFTHLIIFVVQQKFETFRIGSLDQKCGYVVTQ
jgi:hypothetical protein